MTKNSALGKTAVMVLSFRVSLCWKTVDLMGVIMQIIDVVMLIINWWVNLNNSSAGLMYT